MVQDTAVPKRLLESAPDGENEEAEEDSEAKRRRILEETRDIDADSEGSDDDSSEEESDDEDEAAELMRELEKIKKERLAQKEKEEQEREVQEQEQREVDIARGNPLLNPQDFNMKRRWDDDVVFKNQARGTEKKDGKEFVNVRMSCGFPADSGDANGFSGLAALRLPQEIHGMYMLPLDTRPLLTARTSQNMFARAQPQATCYIGP